jgi:hypothetical protein
MFLINLFFEKGWLKPLSSPQRNYFPFDQRLSSIRDKRVLCSLSPRSGCLCKSLRFSQSVRSIASIISGRFDRSGRIRRISGRTVIDGDIPMLNKNLRIRCIQPMTFAALLIYKQFDKVLEMCALLFSSRQTINDASIVLNGFDRCRSISTNSCNMVSWRLVYVCIWLPPLNYWWYFKNVSY